MKATIIKKVTFEAAHWLPHMPEGHKCRRMHGHSYSAEICVRGDVGDDGIVIDYADIKAAWIPLEDQLDHRRWTRQITDPEPSLFDEVKT